MTRARDRADIANAIAHTNHFIFTENDGSGTYAGWSAYPQSFTDPGFASNRAGIMNGSRLLPDGKTSFVAFRAHSNPSGSGMRIHALGNESAGNSGFTAVSWSNEDGTSTGNITRANMTYTSQTPSSTSRWSRRWELNVGSGGTSTFTGDNPRTIADDGYIELVFS